MIGKTLGHYEITGSLGKGGMGEVYRATDTRLRRPVALKVLPPHLSSNPKLLQRFEREARALAELSHPHICTLFDVGSAEDVHFLVMELLEGESLADRLSRGRLPVEHVLRIGMQLCDALDHAHRSGIVHRDLKPGNVMLGASGAKLLDFGLARPTELVTTEPVESGNTEAMPVTVEGAILGTLDYMSPEQVKGMMADRRSDIFALGSVLYEMLTGQRPFTGENKPELMAAILTAGPRPLAEESRVPPGLARLVDRCLEKDPERRWQSARDILLELEWLASEKTPDELEPTRRTWATALPWTVAALLAIALGLLSLRGGELEQAGAPILLTAQLPGQATVQSTRVSPDGRTLLMTGTIDGQDGIWIRPLDSMELRVLPRTEEARLAFWAPDSERIAFFQNGSLKTVGLDGAPPEVLCDAPGPFATGSWGSRGVILFSILEAPEREGVYRVQADGGPATRLPLVDEEERPEAFVTYPTFLPDGHHFTVLVGSTDEGREMEARLHLGSLSTGQVAPLPGVPANTSRAEFVPAGYVLYVRAGRLFAQRFDLDALRATGEPKAMAADIRALGPAGLSAFSASNDGILVYETEYGKSQLQWRSRDGKILADVGQPGYYADIRLDPAGVRVAAARREATTEDGEIWIIDPDRGVEVRFTNSPIDDFVAVWSPDGERIVFSAADGAPPFMHVKELAGGEARVLLPSRGTLQAAMCWSSDGAELIYADRDPDTGFDLWVLPMEPGRDPEPLVQTPASEVFAAISPDGAWLAYSSDESGETEIYVRPYGRRGVKQRISTNGGITPRWRSDGAELYYLAQDGTIFATPIDTAGEDLEAGTPQPLFAVEDNLVDVNPYDVTPDGERFLVAAPVHGQTLGPTIVLNWTAALDE